VLKRWAIGVRFVAPEGESYAKLAKREGQTTGQLLRSIFTGERIGGTYVGQSRGRQLSPRVYRAVLVLQLQPAVCQAILAEHEVGTPQRMLWSMPLYAGYLPPLEMLPSWPGPLDWTPDPGDLRRDPGERIPAAEIPVDKEVIAEIRLARHTRANNMQGTYDGQRPMLLIKVAALLGELRSGKPVVETSDWALAKQVLDMSDQVRDWVVGWVGNAEAQKREASLSMSQARAERETRGRLTVEDAHAEQQATNVRNMLLRYHKQNPKLRRAALVRKTGRYQKLARPILLELVAEGLVAWPDSDDTPDAPRRG
jgi:hypothetical protein